MESEWSEGFYGRGEELSGSFQDVFHGNGNNSGECVHLGFEESGDIPMMPQVS